MKKKIRNFFKLGHSKIKENSVKIVNDLVKEISIKK